MTGAKARIPPAFAAVEIGDRRKWSARGQLAGRSLTSNFQSPEFAVCFADTGLPSAKTCSFCSTCALTDRMRVCAFGVLCASRPGARFVSQRNI